MEGPYVIEEVYHSGAIKINNFEGTNPKVVNYQRIKHYISDNPINIETNIIETVTSEEYIRDTSRNVSDSEKEQVCGTVSKPTPKLLKQQFFSVLEYLRIQENKKQSGKDTRPPRGWRARPTPLGVPPTSWAPRALYGLCFLACYVFWSVKLHYIISRRL